MQRPAHLITEHELHQIFRATPHAYLALTPQFVIVAANQAYLNSTLTDFALIEGRYIFEVFPDNPALPLADGVENLTASLRHVVDYRRPHHMAVQRYDIRFRDKFFIERHWKPANYPVFGEGGRVAHIIHHVEDVTRAVKAAARPLSPGAQMDYAARAERCAERARRSLSPSNRKLGSIWSSNSGSWRRCANACSRVRPILLGALIRAPGARVRLRHALLAR